MTLEMNWKAQKMSSSGRGVTKLITKWNLWALRIISFGLFQKTKKAGLILPPAFIYWI
jgi:hypothetical protein